MDKSTLFSLIGSNLIKSSDLEKVKCYIYLIRLSIRYELDEDVVFEEASDSHTEAIKALE